MYETYYRIAEIVIKVISPFRFYSVNGEDFLCERTEPDYSFRFEQVDNIPALMEDAWRVGETLWSHEYQKADGSFLRAFLWQEEYYSEISILGEREGVCYYASAEILKERAKEGYEMLMYLCLEQILIRFGGLVLHSSHIKIQEKGLVFSASSQTGKSTQAELWQKYAGAKIINGDRSVLRKLDGRWYVCGCPMCGTSGIHLAGREPLSHIVMLAQNQENIVRRLTLREAFHLIYPQIALAYWDTVYVERIMELVHELLIEVPVWHYACTMGQEAVTVLKKELQL